MFNENLARCRVKIEATNFFLVFSFYFQSLGRNEVLIALVILLLVEEQL